VPDMNMALGTYRRMQAVDMLDTQSSAGALDGSWSATRQSCHAFMTPNEALAHNRRNPIMRRILVPADFSAVSRPAIHYALALTAAVEGDLLLLHVVEGNPLPRYVVGETPEIFPAWMDFTGRLYQKAYSPTIIHHDRCEEARWKLASLLPSGCPERFRPLVTVGKAATEIVRVATDQQVDLILLGSQPQRRWRHVIWPTVPTQVMHRASIPVMLLCTVGSCVLPWQPNTTVVTT
jgi:nucleotide-binding universal stress UspA family protein